MEEEKPTVLYICDRRACAVCHRECSHTKNINHAENFSREYGAYIEGGIGHERKDLRLQMRKLRRAFTRKHLRILRNRILYAFRNPKSSH